MRNIWIDVPIVVRLYNDTRTTYCDLDAAVKAVGYPQIKRRRQDDNFLYHFSYDLPARPWALSTGPYEPGGYCQLRDVNGILVPDWAIEEAIGRTGIRYYSVKWWMRWQVNQLRRHGAYREGGPHYRRPEGGHAKKDGRGAEWRPKTGSLPRHRRIALKRQAEADEMDEDILDIPASHRARVKCHFRWCRWEEDDYPRSWRDKSWKQHRRKQYRERPQGRS